MIRGEKKFSSWGGKTTVGARGADLAWRGEPWPSGESRLLAYGMGRSYGDSCLLDHGYLLGTRQLDHLIAFDQETGVVRCEAGCTLARLLEFCVPLGWFVPVTPGTKFVTVGGCVANDVHGKNHHRVGTFGCFVTRLGLLRSDGIERECSLMENPGLFRATIGGLGLTGIILWVELRLRKIHSPLIEQQVEPLHGIDAFFEIARRDETKFEHSVAWLDATHAGEPRGIFIAGNHSEEPQTAAALQTEPRITLPVTLPDFAFGRWSIRLLNSSYYNLNALRSGRRQVDFEGFFYPLDAVADWNRAYGRRGLVQYQFVVPMEAGPEVLRETLAKVQASGEASFLTVVKLFGAVRSPGLLSFPRPGVTVCFDFPYRGDVTERLLADLDRTIFACDGALYPAKDCRMDRAAFERSFPRHREFKEWIDPACSSNFARRAGLAA